MAQYMLLLRETPATYADLCTAEMEVIIERYRAWSAQLAQQGRLACGELSDDDGHQLRMAAGKRLASDGPYAEALA